MKTKLFTFIICMFILSSCRDTASTSSQNQVEQLKEKTAKALESSPEVDSEMAKKIIPDGFKIVSYEKGTNFLKGDFNGDNAQDFAAIIASDEAEFFQDAKDVRVVIYEQQPNNDFKKVAESGNLDGYFIHNAPTSQLHLNKNVLSVKRQDMRFDNEWKFRYENSIDDYVLIGSEYNNYGNAVGDGSGNRSTNYLSGKRIEEFSEWDMTNEKLSELPTITTSVNLVKEKPILLKDFNEQNFYDL
ncbi:MAG: hypothetical protein AB8G11_19955 [Saprospiraceae bacterium]